MLRWSPIVLLVACGSKDAAPKPDRADDCFSGGRTEVAVIQQLTFAREVDGTSVGFDLDQDVSTAGGSGGCGVADMTSPEGTPGIDNSFARLLPALELTEGAALEAIVQEAINSGGLLVMMQLDDVEDPFDDECVSMSVMGGVGVPMVGADGLILPAQTFDPDPDSPVTQVDGLVLSDGVVEGGPIDLDLPFAFLDADIVFEVEEGRMRMERHDDGRITGMVGGGIAIQALSDLAHNTGIGEEVENLLDAVLGVSADLAPGPTGECEQISVTLEFEAIQAFFYED